MFRSAVAFALSACVLVIDAAEFHVATHGNDAHDGSVGRPLRTISAAARVTQPGDVITVHAGTYRERVTPPRGGSSDTRRITYQAAPGETVVIKGSEVVRGWQPVGGGVWKVTLPNTFFSDYNPYTDQITGDWFDARKRVHHTGEVYLNGKSLWETDRLEGVLEPKPVPNARDSEGSTWTWYSESDGTNTILHANFHDRDPNTELVEINVRDSCFYPDRPGCDFITVRGFRMCHAATQWAAPTAEQIGLIGTHWSRGWIIENNIISDSKCSGITLGKDRATGHNVWSNEPSKDGATHYNEVVDRALAAGWSRATIGSHLVRSNTIFNCEQTGICGSLGAVFSRIERNHIHDIWTKRQFAGAEMAGIKLHAAIDTVIERNYIHHAGRGLWMDWMAQGTQISRNICHDNTTDDLFVEVNHGPFLVDNNIFLSPVSVRDWSQGGAFAHNLMAGQIQSRPVLKRVTPHHQAHSTVVAGRTSIPGGDHRFYNNLFVGDGSPAPQPAKPDAGDERNLSGFGLWMYDARPHPSSAGGNVFYHGASPQAHDTDRTVLPKRNPRLQIFEDSNRVFLGIDFGCELAEIVTSPVTTERLSRARVPGLGFENPDGSPLVIDRDLLGRKRSATTPTPGPFEQPGVGPLRIRMW